MTRARVAAGGDWYDEVLSRENRGCLTGSSSSKSSSGVAVAAA